MEKALVDLLKTGTRFLITTHIHPDGDAAGSLLGLATSLRLRGAVVDTALSTPIGDRFQFLFENEQVLSPEDVQGPYDAVIILDIGSENRTGFQEILRNLDCPIINIDHHATNTGFGNFDILDPNASSTCEMLYKVITEAHLPLNAETAKFLYLGLLTDSRYFQNSNVRPETFHAAAALLETGFNHQTIIRKLVQSRSETDLKVLGLGLSAHKTLENGKIIYTVIRQKELIKLNATYRHAWSAGVFGYLISMQTALVAVSFVESPEGLIFCEFRSKDGFDVSSIALSLGGGGHRSASGCSLNSSMEVAVDRVLNKVITEVRKYSDN